ncbi:hypothetical protein DUI87_16504 [Hirundo rustica rustica]|uniref:Uncharacterized protein n=1 Tax=Hirundo rustica rustica TaxID=333673 RepID=A0A3M0K3Q5_HIRRU|nr:hypothetical protein DUI87_16504 [Hirundo rustica rustica]
MVRKAVPLKPKEVWAKADIHLQPVEDPRLEHVGAVTLWGVHPEAGSWQNLCLSERLILEQPVPEGLHPMERSVNPMEQFANYSL